MSDEPALHVLLTARNRLLDDLWDALTEWEASDAPAWGLVTELRLRGLIP